MWIGIAGYPGFLSLVKLSRKRTFGGYVAHVFLESFHSTNSGNALTEIRRIDSNQKRLLIGFIYHRIKQTVTMKLFFCNGTDWHDIRKKRQCPLYWTLVEEFWKISLKGWFCAKTAIWGLFWQVCVWQGLRVSTRAIGAPFLKSTFSRDSVSV